MIVKLTKPNFSCFDHIVNIANVAVMGHVTKIAAVENANAIWEYDPSLPNNRILGGFLNVIAAVRMIAVKVNWPHCQHLKFFLALSDSGFQAAHRVLWEASASMQV